MLRLPDTMHTALKLHRVRGERRQVGRRGARKGKKVGAEREDGINRERLRYSVFQKGQRDLRKKKGEGGWGGILEDEWP